MTLTRVLTKDLTRDLTRDLIISDESVFSPLSLNPLFIFDTQRITGYASSSPMLKVRRLNAADEISIYGFNPSDPRQYQTSAGGAYETTESLLFPQERFYVIDWYDQGDNSNNAQNLTDAVQPELYWPAATLGSEVGPAIDFSTWNNYNSTDTTDTFTTTSATGGIFKNNALTVGTTYRIISGGTINQNNGTFYISTGFASRQDLYVNNGTGNFVNESIVKTNYDELYYRITSGSIGDNVTLSSLSVKEVLTWDYPVVKPDGFADYMNLSFTNSSSNYTLFAIIKQLNTAETLDYILDVQTGVLRFAYPADSANTVGYYDSAWRTASLSETDWLKLSMVLESSSSGRIQNGETVIGSGLSYTQKAIGGNIRIFSDYLGNNNSDAMVRALMIFPSALSQTQISSLVEYYS
jgi:hypothetical protein